MALKIDAQLRGFDLCQVPAQARRLEELGFDAAWTFEAAQDPFLPLAVAATATEKLELGTNIAVAFARSPFSMAGTAWDIQRASRGRLHLGLGTQVRAHVERRFSMPFDRPAARVTDYIRCMRAIFDTFQTDARPSYEGPFYQFRLMNPFFNPGPIDHPHIPIYLAGVNPRMCRAAGEAADGFHIHPMHSVSYLNEVVKPAIGEGAKTRGLGVDDLDLQTMVWLVTGDSQAEMDAAFEQVRRDISFYGSTPNYRRMLEHHGLADLGKTLSGLVRQGAFDEMAALVPDSFVEDIAIIGKPDELGDRLRSRYDGLVDRVAPYRPIPDSDQAERWQAFIAAVRG